MKEIEPLIEGPLSQLIEILPTLSDPGEGFYVLFAPAGTIQLEAGTHCAIRLLLDEEDDNLTIYSKDGQVLEIADDVRTAQNILSNAKKQKPNATVEDLVKALNYYSDNDSYIIYDT